MKYFAILCTLFTLNIFSSHVHVDIDNISGESVRISYTDINGIQEKKIETDTYIAIPIQTTAEKPDLSLSLKIKNKPLKHFIVLRGSYHRYTINPDPEIKKTQKLKRKRRKIRFK